MQSLPIPPRTQRALQPGSTHVRLFNLDQSLDEGSTPILNLAFAQIGLQRVRVPVRPSPPESAVKRGTSRGQRFVVILRCFPH